MSECNWVDCSKIQDKINESLFSNGYRIALLDLGNDTYSYCYVALTETITNTKLGVERSESFKLIGYNMPILHSLDALHVQLSHLSEPAMRHAISLGLSTT